MSEMMPEQIRAKAEEEIIKKEVVITAGIVESIKHWKQMIEWVKKQDPNDYADSFEMKRNLGTHWYGDSCALCQLADEYFEGCEGCPVAEIDTDCSDDGSAWFRVQLAHKWHDWLEAAAIMVDVLETAYANAPDSAKEDPDNV